LRTGGSPGAGRAALLLGALLAPAAALSAQAAGDKVEIVPIEEEIRVALSAAPEHLRAEAGVLALTANGWTTARESRNGFTCVVNRDHPLNRKPTCYDAEGTATVLPKVMFVGEQLLAGIPLGEINRKVNAKFASGEFISPRRPGIAYMLSPEIRRLDPATGEVGSFPPHLMFYGPNLTNGDIGAAPPQARAGRAWLPFVGYQGPHGFIIVVVGQR